MLRIVGIKGRNTYDDEKTYSLDLADGNQHPEAKVCVWTTSEPGICRSMRAIAAKGGAQFDGLRIGISDFAEGRIRFRIKDKKRDFGARTLMIPRLKNTVLCKGLKWPDTKHDVELSFHLDDP